MSACDLEFLWAFSRIRADVEVYLVDWWSPLLVIWILHGFSMGFGWIAWLRLARGGRAGAGGEKGVLGWRYLKFSSGQTNVRGPCWWNHWFHGGRPCKKWRFSKRKSGFALHQTFYGGDFKKTIDFMLVKMHALCQFFNFLDRIKTFVDINFQGGDFATNGDFQKRKMGLQLFYNTIFGQLKIITTKIKT